jgi:glycosyltransferase involved in cell wall biosynthesis
MKKIVLIYPIEGPINGVKVIGKEIINELKKNKFDFKLIDTSQAKEYINFGKFSLKKIILIFNIIRHVFRINKNSIVLLNFSVNGYSFYRDFIILKFLLIRTSNITLHIHSNGLENINKKYFIKHIDKCKIIIINEYQKQLLDKYSSVFILKNALPDFYQNEFSPVINTDEKTRLLFMSNLSKPKGIDLLKKICQELKLFNKNYLITICGGVLDEYSEQVLNDILKEYVFVKYVGPIHEETQKMNLYKNQDFTLFLSDINYEVYPLVYIESMMNGVPIITTKQRVSSDIVVNECGIVIEGQNYIDYIDNKMINQDRLKKQVRSVYEKNYKFEAFFKNLLEILQNEA